MTYYKLVLRKRNDEQWWSVSVGGGRLKYYFDKPTLRPKLPFEWGPLTAFDDYDTARAFAIRLWYGPDDVVGLCTCDLALSKPLHFTSPREVWYVTQRGGIRRFRDLPDGTILADQIQLVEFIRDFDCMRHIEE